MKRFESGTLGTIDDNESTAAKEISHLKDVIITCEASVSPVWAGAAAVEISQDGTTWSTAPIYPIAQNDPTVANASFAYVVPGRVKQIRVTGTSVTVGSLVCSYGGVYDE